MGSVTKKQSPVVIIKKKRRILSHQDDAIQAIPDDIKAAPVMEFKTDSLPQEIPATVAGSPEQQKKTGRKKKKKRRTMDGIMSLSDTVWTVLKNVPSVTG